MQFKSELELKVTVLDKELDRLEKRIAKSANPFSASGAKKLDRVQSERLKFEKQIAQVQLDAVSKIDKKRTQSFKTAVRRQNFLRKQRLETEAKVARKRKDLIQGLQLGVGFPLLFGGGAGSVAGGALGALTDSSGGFGGQILFSALGQQIDTFIQNLGNLADSLDSAENILDGLADAGFRVSKELRTSVEILEDQGRFLTAYNVALGELERRFGPNAVQELANYNAANAALQEEFSKAAGTLQRELLPALTLVTNAVAGLLSVINQSGGILKFLAGLVPGVGPSLQAAGAIGGEGARRITSSPTNALGFQSNAGASAAADKERLAREEQSADLVREINRNQKAINRAREEAARKELKHQQDVLKLVRDRVLLEAQLIEDQLRLQAAQRSTQLQQAQAKAAAQSALLRAEQETAVSAINSFGSGGTSPNFANPAQAFASKLSVEYDIIDEKVKDLGGTLLQAGANTEFDKTATTAYREELKAAAEEAARVEQARFETPQDRVDKQLEQLNLQLESAQAITREEKQQAELELRLLRLRNANKDLTEDQLKSLEAATTALFNATNLGPLEQYIKNTSAALADTEQQMTKVVQIVEGQLASGIANFFNGIIDGSKSAEEAFADMLKSMGQALVQTAAQMIAQYIAIGIARIFAGMGGGGGGGGASSVPSSAYGDMSVAGPSFFQGGMIPGYSTGGFIGADRVALVSENGPELIRSGPTGTSVTNNEDTKAAMERFSPSNQEAAAGGPMNPTINYNGPSLNFNGDDYIPRSEAGSLVAAGAKQGETRAINRLRNSRMTRSKIGI